MKKGLVIVILIILGIIWIACNKKPATKLSANETSVVTTLHIDSIDIDVKDNTDFTRTILINATGEDVRRVDVCLLHNDHGHLVFQAQETGIEIGPYTGYRLRTNRAARISVIEPNTHSLLGTADIAKPEGAAIE